MFKQRLASALPGVDLHPYEKVPGFPSPPNPYPETESTIKTFIANRNALAHAEPSEAVKMSLRYAQLFFKYEENLLEYSSFLTAFSSSSSSDVGMPEAPTFFGGNSVEHYIIEARRHGERAEWLAMILLDYVAVHHGLSKARGLLSDARAPGSEAQCDLLLNGRYKTSSTV